MAEQGMIYDVNDTKRKLLDANKNYNNRQTWSNMFNLNNMLAARSQQSLQSSYLDAANQAYSSYLSGQRAIEGSNIVGAGKEGLLASNEATLNEAYNKYMQSFSEGREQIEANRLDTAMEIDKDLTTQAKNINAYAMANLDYLPYLYEQYLDRENTLFDSPEWSKFIVDYVDDAGNPQQRLMSREELLGQMFDKGNLTLKGAKFFDQMQNAPTNDGLTSGFGQYLAERDEDLFNWSTSYNQYDTISSNLGRFKSMVGLDPDDLDYTAMDKLAGWDEDEIKGMYSKFEETFTKVNELDLSKHGNEAVRELKASSKEVFKLAKDLGLDKVLSDAHFDEQAMNNIYDAVIRATKSKKEMDAEWWTATLSGAGVGASVAIGKVLAPVAAGSMLTGPAAPVVAGSALLIAAIIGFAVGGIGAGVLATHNQNLQKEQNKELATAQKQRYKEMLDYMTTYSLQLQRQAAIDFGNK